MDTQVWVQLPADLQGAFDVFVNGIPQTEGTDFRRRGNRIEFTRELKKEGRLGTLRWLSMLLGIAGTYRQNDVVDVAYEAGGRRTVAADLPLNRG